MDKLNQFSNKELAQTGVKDFCSGYEFLAFTSGSKFIFVGKPDIEEETLHLEEQEQVCKLVPHYLDNSLSNFPAFEMKYACPYKPVYCSAQKKSFALLLRDRKELNEDFIDKLIFEFKDMFDEIVNSMKLQELSFHEFFLEGLTFEKMRTYVNNINQFNYKICMNEEIFMQKIRVLVSEKTRNMKLHVKFVDKLKKFFPTRGGLINMLIVYYLFHGVYFDDTKLIIGGDIAYSCSAMIKEDLVEFYDNNSTNYMIYDYPFVSLPLVQVEVGESHILVLTVEGMLFSWGNGEGGATGNGIFNFHSTPKQVKFPSGLTFIKKICCGARHNMCLDSAGYVYSWGIGKNGRLGHGKQSNEHYPKKIEYLNNIKVDIIGACDNYSAAISYTTRDLYTWGNGQFGRLGHDFTNDELFPRKVDTLSNVESIDCNYYTLVATTKTGEIHCIGKKQLFSKNIPEKEGENEFVYFDKPSEINRKVNLKPASIPMKLLKVNAGYQFTAVMTSSSNGKGANKKNIYINGSLTIRKQNKDYKFSSLYAEPEPFEDEEESLILEEDKEEAALVEDEEEESEKQEIVEKHKEEKNETGVKKICCSENNTAMLTHDGELYVFGSYIYSVATKDYEKIYTPIFSKAIKITKVAMGSNHICVLSNNNEVFSWGRNREGQMGLGSTSQFISKPTFISKLKSLSPTKIYASENYSGVISYANEAYLFGDISFLENNKHINYQLYPKKHNWGKVFKMACGPTHILILSIAAGSTDITLKAIGNGYYGKLGANGQINYVQSFIDNVYEPREVNVPVTNIRLENIKKFKIRCTRFSSLALIPEGNQSNVYVWGLCNTSLFDPKELEKIQNQRDKFSIKIKTTEDKTFPINPIRLSLFNNITNIAVNETAVYMLNDKNVIRTNGSFKKKGQELEINGEYKKVTLGKDHAAAINLKNRLFTFGSNVMFKCGIVQLEENVDNLINIDKTNIAQESGKYWFSKPEPVNEINRKFQEKYVMKQKEEEDLPETDQPVNTTPEGEQPENKGEENENDNLILRDNIFEKTKKVAVHKFTVMEKKIKDNEVVFKKKINEILTESSQIKTNHDNKVKTKKLLYNLFLNKFREKPFNVALTKRNTTRYPKCYNKFREHYKALLSTLKIHPCYLVNLYSVMNHDDLYKVAKHLFYGSFTDKFSHYLLVNLTKQIFRADINKIKEENPNLTRSELLDKYRLFSLEGDEPKLTFSGKLIKLFLKNDSEHLVKVEQLAKVLINNIYAELQSKSGSEMKNVLRVFVPRDYKEKGDQKNSSLMNNQITSKINKIYDIIEKFFLYIKAEKNAFESLDKGTLFQIASTEEITSNHIFELSSDTSMLIKELVGIFKKNLNLHDLDKVDEWLAYNVSLIVFDRVIKVVSHPGMNFTCSTQLLQDETKYYNFTKYGRLSCYSLAMSLKKILINLLSGNEGLEDEISKKVTKKLKDNKTWILGSLKNMFYRAYSDKKISVDSEMTKVFFEHSKQEEDTRINIPLVLVKRLQGTITRNIDKIRVLSEGFDLMDVIFFSKEENMYIGVEGGLAALPDDSKVIVQVKLKSRTLAYQTPSSIMKCKRCACILLHEFNLSNETNFFKEFEFILKSSEVGSFIEVLRTIGKIDSDDTAELIRGIITEGFNVEFIEAFHYMCRLIAIQNKNSILIEDKDINDREKLFKIMLNEEGFNSRLKDYCRVILDNFEGMVEHVSYQQSLMEDLSKISNVIQEGVPIDQYFMEIRNNMTKGYGNPEMNEYLNFLDRTSVFKQIDSVAKGKSKSKNLYGKLTQKKKEQLLPYREYKMSDLKNKKVIVEVKMEEIQVFRDMKRFKVAIEKNKLGEYVISILEVKKVKSTRFFICSTMKELNSVKRREIMLSNDDMNVISKLALKEENERQYAIEDFLVIDALHFCDFINKMSSQIN